MKTNPVGVWVTQVPYNPRPVLEVSKSNNATTTITTGSTVNYEITVRNNSDGSAYDAVLYDILRDEGGYVIDEGNWFLGEIFPHEEITVSYSLDFSVGTKFGIYTNSAEIVALGGYKDPTYGYTLTSNVATSDVFVDGRQWAPRTERSSVPTEGSIEEPEGVDEPEEVQTVERTNEVIAEVPEIQAGEYTESGSLAYRSHGGDYALRQANTSSTSEQISNLLAATFFAFPDGADELLKCALPTLIAFYLIMFLIWRIYKHTAEKYSWEARCDTNKCVLAFFAGATIIGYGVAAFTDFTCILVPFLLVLVMLIILNFAERYKN